jgi:4-methyl-5(b-hydroxyethyl)-thiazole monophosphate biosynthesis
VVVDGNLITSQGAGTATQFGLALIAHLVSQKVADEVAASICWK